MSALGSNKAYTHNSALGTGVRDIENWSQYPASQNVDMDNFSLENLNGIVLASDISVHAVNAAIITATDASFQTAQASSDFSAPVLQTATLNATDINVNQITADVVVGTTLGQFGSVGTTTLTANGTSTLAGVNAQNIVASDTQVAQLLINTNSATTDEVLNVNGKTYMEDSLYINRATAGDPFLTIEGNNGADRFTIGQQSGDVVALDIFNGADSRAHISAVNQNWFIQNTTFGTTDDGGSNKVLIQGNCKATKFRAEGATNNRHFEFINPVNANIGWAFQVSDANLKVFSANFGLGSYSEKAQFTSSGVTITGDLDVTGNITGHFSASSDGAFSTLRVAEEFYFGSTDNADLRTLESQERILVCENVDINTDIVSGDARASIRGRQTLLPTHHIELNMTNTPGVGHQIASTLESGAYHYHVLNDTVTVPQVALPAPIQALQGTRILVSNQSSANLTLTGFGGTSTDINQGGTLTQTTTISSNGYAEMICGLWSSDSHIWFYT